MEFPKFVIASDGHHTGLLLDGVFFGQGIDRLEFSTENTNGKMESTIRIMDLKIESVALGDAERFSKFLKGIAETPEATFRKALDALVEKN